MVEAYPASSAAQAPPRPRKQRWSSAKAEAAAERSMAEAAMRSGPAVTIQGPGGAAPQQGPSGYPPAAAPPGRAPADPDRSWRAEMQMLAAAGGGGGQQQQTRTLARPDSTTTMHQPGVTTTGKPAKATHPGTNQHQTSINPPPSQGQSHVRQHLPPRTLPQGSPPQPVVMPRPAAITTAGMALPGGAPVLISGGSPGFSGFPGGPLVIGPAGQIGAATTIARPGGAVRQAPTPAGGMPGSTSLGIPSRAVVPISSPPAGGGGSISAVGYGGGGFPPSSRSGGAFTSPGVKVAYGTIPPAGSRSWEGPGGERRADISRREAGGGGRVVA